jgi:hypothetical protein
MKIHELLETTAGATSTASVSSSTPVYRNRKGKSAKNKNGTVKNALDMKDNLLTGGSIKR